MFSSLLDDTGESQLLEAIETELTKNQEAGVLLKGGIRKMRIASTKRPEGKRGGYRIWYFFDKPHETFYLLFLLDKREAPDLTSTQEQLLSDEFLKALSYSKTKGGIKK